MKKKKAATTRRPRRPQERVTTARFSTDECLILLRAWNQTMEKGLIFPTSDEEYMTFLKIRNRLEERIYRENQKNKSTGRNKGDINGKTEEEHRIDGGEHGLSRETTYREYDLKGDIL